jgi:hypothetical protein
MRPAASVTRLQPIGKHVHLAAKLFLHFFRELAAPL